MTTPIPFFSISDLGSIGSSSALLASWLSQMQAAFPGYSPSAGNLEYVQAQIFASQAADLGQLASSGANALFEAFGQNLLNVPLQLGSPAIAIVSVTAIDSAGYTLPIGTQISLTLDGAPLGFLTGNALTIATGQTSGQVLVNAVQPGTDFNGAGSPAALLSQIDWVSSVSVVTSAASGVDAEDEDHYLNRLRAQIQLMAPRPITASDYATMALSFIPAAGTDQQEVGRATAVDGYDPTANTYFNEREVTVCVTDGDGDALNGDTLAAISTFLSAFRESNFIVNVVNPNYTSIYVSATVIGQPGFLASQLQSAVQTSLLTYLAPASFGLPFTNATLGWQNTLTIYRSAIEAVIQNTQGVAAVVPGSLAIDFQAVPGNTTGDLQLPGPFPLPVTSATTIPLSAIQVISQ